MKGGMYGKVISMDKWEKASPEFIQGMEIPHVKSGHPLVLHGTEPALDLLSEHSDKKSYTKLFIIRIFFERYCLYGIFLKKDADKNISIYDNRGTNHKVIVTQNRKIVF